MRAGTNSHILVLKQWCLAPAFGCDAQRALRRVVALGPHIPVLLACFSVSLHHGLAVSAGSAPVTDTALLFLCAFCVLCGPKALRSEEHTSELQSLMRISYAVLCFKKKKL